MLYRADENGEKAVLTRAILLDSQQKEKAQWKLRKYLLELRQSSACCILVESCCRYLNAIQTNSQHLLRYLAAAVIVNKRRRNVMKDLVKIIEQESYEYRDPITGVKTI